MKELNDKSEFGTIDLTECKKLNPVPSTQMNDLATPNHDHTTQTVTPDVVVSVTSRNPID